MANKTSWKPGQSGNPAGRPRRGRTVSDLIRRIGAEKVPYGEEAEPVVMARREALARMLWNRAIYEEDLAAARVILEYSDGKPLQRVEAQVTPRPVLPFTADEAAEAQAELLTWRGLALGGDEEADESAGAQPT